MYQTYEGFGLCDYMAMAMASYINFKVYLDEYLTNRLEEKISTFECLRKIRG